MAKRTGRETKDKTAVLKNNGVTVIEKKVRSHLEDGPTRTYDESTGLGMKNLKEGPSRLEGGFQREEFLPQSDQGLAKGE